MHVTLPSINIGLENVNGAAGMIEIVFHQPITPVEVNNLIELTRQQILNTFQYTRTMMHINEVMSTFLESYADISEVSLDNNIVDLSKNELNDLFCMWFNPDDVDIVFTVSDHEKNFPFVLLSDEGSNEKLIELLQSHGVCA